MAYKHPVFVYIPPNGELRGGAWVVIDPTINDEVLDGGSCVAVLYTVPGLCTSSVMQHSLFAISPLFAGLGPKLSQAKLGCSRSFFLFCPHIPVPRRVACTGTGTHFPAVTIGDGDVRRRGVAWWYP